MSSLQVGNIVEGVVTGITNFGAFVQLPDGETGLVHISEVSSSYVKDISEHLNKKDKVKVKILSINGDGKIGLSIKRANESPREKSSDRKKQFSKRDTRMSFDEKVSKFMKESEEKQQDLRKNTDSKRGGNKNSFRSQA